MKRILSLIFGLLIPLGALAQGATAKSFWDDPMNHPQLRLYLLITFVSIVIILIIVVLLVMIRTLSVVFNKMDRQSAEAAGRVYVQQPTWWDKLAQQLNDSVPVTQEKDIELDHNFDGIKELDNHLPPWWKWLFYLSIVWSVVYIFIYHFSNTLPLSREEYDNEVAFALESQQKFLASQPKANIDVTTLEYTNDAEIIKKGKMVFEKINCASCHRNDGGGNVVGPNLTDEYWLHGGSIKNIFNTINTGVVEKGMPAWGKAMSPADVRDVTFYVMSLQRSKPANAKAPQGELFKPEIKSTKSDSTKMQASLK